MNFFPTFNAKLAVPCSRVLRFVAWLVAFDCLTPAITHAEEPKPPNIVLIVADDLGYGELGCYGQKLIKTPRIDELARQGLRFTQYYCGSPVCAPSRCTLMTGKHTGHAAIRNNKKPQGMELLREKFDWQTPGQQPLPESEVTIAELLHTKGYATAAIGKWGLGMVGTNGEPNRQGIDLFYGFLCQEHAHNHYPKFLWRNGKKEPLPGNDGTATGQTYAQDKFTGEALRFVREHRELPFFLYLPFTIPHLAIQVPDESLAQYAGKIPEAEYDHKGYFKHPAPRAGYAAMITHMDAAVGTIVDTIDELGLADDTLILFTSDNGPTFERIGGADSDFFESSGPLRGRKGTVYEGGIRVPLIARWTGKIVAGHKTDQMAAHWDLLPTLCEIAKADTPQKLDGISFAPTLFGKGEQQQREYLYWEFPAYGVQQAIRAGNWKALRRGNDLASQPFELYDLGSDIGEERNVAAEHPEVVQRLSAYAAAAHTPSNVFPLFASERPTPKKPVGAKQ
jgi:arylsulfatase